MYHLLLIITLWINGAPDLSIAVAEGNKGELPTQWISFDSLANAEIGKSYWAKVVIQSADGDQLTLQGGNWYMQNIHFYDEDLTLLEVGNSLAITSKNQQVYYLFYPFHDEKESDYFKITISSTEYFLARRYSKNIFQSAFHSILIFVLLVCCFFVAGSMSGVYLNYILYILSILVFFSYH